MKRAVSALVGIGLLIVLAYVGVASQYVSAGRLSDAPNDTPTDTPTDMPTSTPTVTNTPDPCAPVWSVVSSPSVPGNDNYLQGVAAVSANDVWAVGYYQGNYTQQTLVEHWDGTSWSVVSSPNVGKLYGVAAVSANDVWAVGYYINSSNIAQTLVEHWDGTSWSVVPSPNVGSLLQGVAAVSANDVWAAGYYINSSNIYQTLVLHWDGTSWSVVPSPNAGTSDNYFYGVAAVAANDVWAVGYYYMIPYQGPEQTLVEHWNGNAWSVVPSPNPGYDYNLLYGVAAVSANDVWAVGYYHNNSRNQTLVEHWNGTAWSWVPSPNPSWGYNYLNGVTAVAANDVWAVGDYLNDMSAYQTLVLHWDGTSWSVVPSPNPSNNKLYGVAAVSANDVWAVGGYYGGAGQTLVEHYTSPCATPTSTPTNTPTITPTITPTPAPMLTSHVTWQGPPAQPNARQQLPITLTLKLGATEVNYPSQNTDASGFFTASLGSLPAGTYEWRVKGPKYLANSGIVNLAGAPSTQAEMGLMRAGDANNDNVITVVDVGILRHTFALCIGDSGYDARADFDNSNCVSSVDFNLLRGNFGIGGAPPLIARKH